MITVWPNSSTARRSRPSTSAEDLESRLPVGSSAKTTAGRETSARAMATRCCWPPESSAGRCVRRSRRPTASTSVSSQPSSAFVPASISGSRMFSRADEDRDQVEGLEDEAELVAAQRGEALVVEVRELLAVDDDRAGGRPVQAGEQVHERRLARARRAHDRRELPGREVHRDALERVHRSLPLPVRAVQVGGRDDGWRGHGDSLPKAAQRPEAAADRGRPREVRAAAQPHAV